MNALRLTAIQVRYVNKAFWRNPASAFFTFVFPLMFLVIFTSLLGHSTVRIGTRSVDTSTYYVSAMACFAAISACFTNIAISITFQREEGVLKRVNGTPLPAASFLGARILHAAAVGILLVVITAAFGHGLYHASVPSGMALLQFIVVVLIGSGAFCALGLAATAIIPNSDAAAAVVNALILPLQFLSGIFIPFDNGTPSWILWVARVFPIRHLALGMQAGFIGTPFDWTDVLVVAIWGVAGLLLAIRFFSWEPRQG